MRGLGEPPVIASAGMPISAARRTRSSMLEPPPSEAEGCMIVK